MIPFNRLSFSIRRLAMIAGKLPRSILVLSLIFVLSMTGCSDSDSGGSGPDPDTTLPAVVATYPAQSAVDVSRTGPFWVVFSEPMDEESVDDNIEITGGASFNFYWNDGGDTLFFAASVLLSANTTYGILIGEESEDLASNMIGADYYLSFTTTSESDVTAPTVTSVYPENGAEGVNSGAVLEIVFSEPIVQFGDWDLQTYILISPKPEDGYFEFQGNSVLIYHYPFPTETLVSIEITTGIEDLSGNNLAAAYNFSFTTMADNIRPYLESSVPANQSWGVSTGLETMSFTFSEPVFPEFDMPDENVDARIVQLFASEPEWNEDFSALEISLAGPLLPGCKYWVYFEDVEDMAGNPISPNPTYYYFTTAGERSYFPIENGYTWYLIDEDIGLAAKEPGAGEYDVLRRIENYNPSTGDFDEVFVRWNGQIENKTFLTIDGNTIYHVGREEYDEGILEQTMIWDEPMPYIKLPVPDHAGESWPVSSTITVGEEVVMSLSGTCEIEAGTVTVSAPFMEGVFVNCYVHHLYVTVQMFEGGFLTGTDEVHQITYLAEGAGPVRHAEIDTEEPPEDHIISVVDWSFVEGD